MNRVDAGVTLGQSFAAAVAMANRLHVDQTRKGGQVPYLSHLISVAGLVLEDGGDETTAIAAVLHDAVEDQGGLPVLDEIRSRFGEQVAAIVDACSDSYGADESGGKAPWEERKQAYLDHLRDRTLSEQALLVAAADKLHNARSLLVDISQDGPDAWQKFNATPDRVLWYYRSMAQLLSDRIPTSRSVVELVRVVAQLEGLLPGQESSGRSPVGDGQPAIA